MEEERAEPEVQGPGEPAGQRPWEPVERPREPGAQGARGPWEPAERPQEPAEGPRDPAGQEAREFTDQGPRESGALVTGAAYGVLFVLGAVFGAVAGLQHSWDVGDFVPPIPVILSVLLFVILYTAGRLMGTKMGAFVPGMGWMLASLVFSVKRPEGDLVVAANAAGYWYLGCGALALVIAVLLIPSTGSWLLREHSYGRGRSMNVSDGMSA